MEMVQSTNTLSHAFARLAQPVNARKHREAPGIMRIAWCGVRGYPPAKLISAGSMLVSLR